MQVSTCVCLQQWRAQSSQCPPQGASGTSEGGAGGGVSTTGHTGRVGIANLEHPVL